MTKTHTLHLAIGLENSAFAGPTASPALNLLNRIDELADLLTIGDNFAGRDGDGPDATLLANWLGARTRQVGVVAAAPVNFLEPFHVSTGIATLDYVTEGRAGLLVKRLDRESAEAARRAIGDLNGFPAPDDPSLVADTRDAVEVIRNLWDSWEDDAIIRDLKSNRFVDGAKLHYIRFKGTRFSVLGPSIVPRPPQGQPIVAATLASADDPGSVDWADVVFLQAGEGELAALSEKVRQTLPKASIFADILVSFGTDTDTADDVLHGAGTPQELVTAGSEWSSRYGLSGLRFIPADPERDLRPLLDDVLPAFGSGESSGGLTLRDRLGLSPVANRYTAANAAVA